jgi:predicted DNA-binding transcriptional regulator AlpA
MRIIRIKTAAERCDVVPLTIRRWATDPKYLHLGFPKLIDLGDNSVGLVEEEFDEWLAERAAKRDVA